MTPSQYRAARTAFGIFLLIMAISPAPAQTSKADEVYCYFTRESEITRRDRDRTALVVCTYDQEDCQRMVNRPWKGVKPYPPFKCQPRKLVQDAPTPLLDNGGWCEGLTGAQFRECDKNDPCGTYRPDGTEIKCE